MGRKNLPRRSTASNLPSTDFFPTEYGRASRQGILGPVSAPEGDCEGPFHFTRSIIFGGAQLLCILLHVQSFKIGTAS